jgi:DNA invertase Pin-like site-specific DNA recombinase
VDAAAGIPCVIYGAKSTEDRRGSIPEPLRECREAIDADPLRRFVADYSDEKFSAYRGSRGPDLVDAMEHAEELAREQGEAELWALHSDRLARGDGRSARHAVEIALWALKRSVRVRTVQDPDTFRDLLYAVVTGQRNHEDSKRKGAASAAGRKRAVERGEYTGSSPDGYRRVVELDENGAVKRRLDVDPARSPVIEKIFGMALRGRGTGEIARAVTDAGWLTKPRLERQQPKPWTIQSVRETLKNPRYAGLARHNGEVVGRGKWPTYISERQHYRIQAQLKPRRPGTGPCRREPYLLARLVSCGRCGSPMHSITGELREDGTFARRYVCSSHHWHRHAGRCPQSPIDADVVEVMFVSAIRSLLVDGSEGEAVSAPTSVLARESWTDSPERQSVLEAVRAGDDRQIDAALDQLLARMTPEAAMLHRIAASRRNARRLETARRFEAWARAERSGRTDDSRAEARKLNRILRNWFPTVTLEVDARSVVVVAERRSPSGAGDSRGRAEVRLDRREWTRWSPVARRTQRIYSEWEDSEILGALQAWADVHGRAPRERDWSRGGSYHPTSSTVRRHFQSWRRGLIRAGLQPTMPETRYRWDDADIVEALQRWMARHGRRPMYSDWLHATPNRPGTSTVSNHFGSWRKGLGAAGLLVTSDPADRS